MPATIFFIRRHDESHRLCDSRWVQTEIQEAGPGNFDAIYAGVGEVERIANFSRNFDRLATERARKDHGNVARPVGKLGIARPLQEWDEIVRRANPRRRLNQRGANAIREIHSAAFGAGAGVAGDSVDLASLSDVLESLAAAPDEPVGASADLVSEAEADAPEDSPEAEPPADSFAESELCRSGFWSFFPSLP
jgi:hypothetical protein